MGVYLSWGRFPDGSNTQRNSVDFVRMCPTPGNPMGWVIFQDMQILAVLNGVHIQQPLLNPVCPTIHLDLPFIHQG